MEPCKSRKGAANRRDDCQTHQAQRGNRIFTGISKSKREIRDVRFVYVGGEDFGNHSGLGKEIFENYKGVEYLGEQRTPRGILQDSHIFVLPSYREGLPRTALEAMSMEVAVVGADACGTRDVVRDGKTGLLVPVKESPALSHPELSVLFHGR